MTATLLEKLSNIQIELKAPKNQFNKFGGYKYRNCEDILEAVKPICHKNRTSLTLDDELVLLGDRYYIRAAAKLYDWDSEITITTSALARETSAKKGMDESQITGSASSYARKYALNGLFNIDDTKDMDTNETAKQLDEKKQSKETEIMKNHATLVSQMDSLGIDFREKLNDYILEKTGLISQNISMLSLKQIELLCRFYNEYINAFKKKKGIA